jgi:hypothetical protein
VRKEQIMSGQRFLFASCIALFATIAAGSDAFVVRFDTTGFPAPFPPCGGLVYRDELIFHNAGAADATVALIGVSNGAPTTARALNVPAGRTRSSLGYCDECGATSTWRPDPQPLLWVAHLDVPDQVQIVSRLLVLAGSPPTCPSFPGGYARTYAGIPMPIVRSLTPPGIPQVHLGTDIGGDPGGTADDGRTNVGIYNGGSSPASASVELRRGCDGGLLESRKVVIPANTVIQLNGFPNVFQGCSGLDTGSFETYVTVTVDQPSFSYAVTLSNERLPLLSMSSSP